MWTISLTNEFNYNFVLYNWNCVIACQFPVANHSHQSRLQLFQRRRRLTQIQILGMQFIPHRPPSILAAIQRRDKEGSYTQLISNAQLLKQSKTMQSSDGHKNSGIATKFYVGTSGSSLRGVVILTDGCHRGIAKTNFWWYTRKCHYSNINLDGELKTNASVVILVYFIISWYISC